jgi:hypothetical protein
MTNKCVSPWVVVISLIAVDCLLVYQISPHCRRSTHQNLNDLYWYTGCTTKKLVLYSYIIQKIRRP